MLSNSWREDYFGADLNYRDEYRSPYFVEFSLDGLTWEEWREVESYDDALEERDILEQRGFDWRILDAEKRVCESRIG